MQIFCIGERIHPSGTVMTQKFTAFPALCLLTYAGVHACVALLKPFSAELTFRQRVHESRTSGTVMTYMLDAGFYGCAHARVNKICHTN